MLLYERAIIYEKSEVFLNRVVGRWCTMLSWMCHTHSLWTVSNHPAWLLSVLPDQWSYILGAYGPLLQKRSTTSTRMPRLPWAIIPYPKNNSAELVIQPNKRYSGKIILIGYVRAIRNNNVAKIFVVTRDWLSAYDNPFRCPSRSTKYLKEKIWISLLSRHHLTKHRLGITSGNCFLLIIIA
jgi:hypothetical protein